MDQWTKSPRQHRSKNPSFSSSLLDAIYRSIDDGEEEELVFYKESMKKKQTSTIATTGRRGETTLKKDEQMDDFRRACLIDKWMEKKVSEKVVVRRKSVPDFKNIPSSGFHSASSSSDSSSGGFSSSEDGSRSKPIRPIRTSLSSKPEHFEQRRSNIYQPHYSHHQLGGETTNSSRSQKQKEGNFNFNKTKSKAMKIYGDLKKVKQPISPGGKLASFLNSLFTAGNTKKGKFSTSVNGVEDLRDLRCDTQSKSTQTSTCSSASSFSRSCLSKTPSSRGTGTKRSVRFYPVSEIVDEDSRPCGYKSLYEQPKEVMMMNQELKFRLMEKNKKIEAAAREFLKNYQEKNLDKKTDSEMRESHPDYLDDGEDDEDDDAASYASSDLFELDNFAAIGIERYREELPVYETTNLDKNRAIANAFLL